MSVGKGAQTLTLPTSAKSLGGFPGVCGMCVSHKVMRHLPCSLLNTNYHILLFHSVGQFFHTLSNMLLEISVPFCHCYCFGQTGNKEVQERQMVGYVAGSHPLPPGNQARTAQGASSESRRWCRLVSAIWAPSLLLGALGRTRRARPP